MWDKIFGSAACRLCANIEFSTSHTLVGFTGKNKKSIIKNGKKTAEKREKEERKETKEVSL